MINIRTTTKWDRIRELINLWLKDNRVYCNNCNLSYNKDAVQCCESPQIGTNIQFTSTIIKQVKAQQAQLNNPFATNKTKTMRMGLMLPPRLYNYLNQYFLKENGHKLFRNGEEGLKDMRQFARKFPQFAVMKKI